MSRRTEHSEEGDAPHRQRFGQRGGKRAQQRKMEQTALLRAGGQAAQDVHQLPVGHVIQVYSRYCRVIHDGNERLCVLRKTMTKLAETAIVVGDEVRFRVAPEGGANESVIEERLPRRTLLTRAASERTTRQQPIVANAQNMLIVASLVNPTVKWGLIDRMIIAAKSGGLRPIVCLNKVDLGDITFADTALDHYASLGIFCLKVSAVSRVGLDQLIEQLKDRTTVLAGHSGVGKSSLIAAIQPGLDIRVGEVSAYTDKGRHTTTSARTYKLDIGAILIDTPGVKMFGLWGVTRDNVLEYFPDVQAGTAPEWRKESYERIAESLSE